MRTSTRYGAAICAVALLAAACSDDDSGADEPATTNTQAVATTAAETTVTESTDVDTTGADTEASDSAPAESAAGTPVDLAAVCPNPLVVQTDWYPQAEYGALFNLIGEGYTIDAANQRLRGPLVTADGPTGIDLELRSGGPAIGLASPRSQIYTDDSIHLAQSNIDAQIIQWDEAPLVAVVGPLDTNPQILMWDGESYPEIDTITQLGEEGVIVNTYGTGGYIAIFVAEGILSAEQIDPAYDGTPARFIAERTIAQQGFASAEPYKYEFVYTEYGQAPKYQLLHDAGFQTYSQTISLPPDRLEEMSPCLERLVPVIQQSIVDYAAEPDRGIETIVDFSNTVDSGDTQTIELGEYAVATMTELGLHGNGEDEVVGNFDAARVDRLLTQIRDAGIDVNSDLTVEDLIDNRFIDESIGFAP